MNHRIKLDFDTDLVPIRTELPDEFEDDFEDAFEDLKYLMGDEDEHEQI